jgi:hypothetical protein
MMMMMLPWEGETAEGRIFTENSCRHVAGGVIFYDKCVCYNCLVQPSLDAPPLTSKTEVSSGFVK